MPNDRRRSSWDQGKLRFASVLCAIVLALTACAPSRIALQSEAVLLPGFPLRQYEQMAEHDVPVFRVDGQNSRVLILVHRAGTLARLGHDHALVAHDVRGYIAPRDARADLYVRLDALAVDEPDARKEAAFDTQPSAEDISGTRYNMLHKVLDAARHPFVRVMVAGMDANGAPKVDVDVNGVVRTVPVTLKHRENAQRFSAMGEFAIRQSDFGIEPLSILGGALQVADQVEVRFAIEARRVHPPLKAGDD